MFGGGYLKKIVVSQPMFLPWVGLFEQIKIADNFVHYDDVQMPQGRSFMSRVQVKTSNGMKWLSIPIRRNGRQLIKDVEIDDSKNWKESHLGILSQCYMSAKYGTYAVDLVESLYQYETDSLADFCIEITEKIADFLGVKREFSISSNYNFSSSSSRKLLNIVMALNGNVYVTGHGAKNYLDHELFEAKGINVEYIQYELKEYQQMYGDFTPYVSIIDLIANMGEKAPDFMVSETVDWKEFVCD